MEGSQAPPSVSCVVATHNRRLLLPRVLDPLFADDHVLEVVVVADACSDGTNAYLAERAEADPRLHWEAVDFGDVGATRQRGAELARASLLLMLDDDTVPLTGLASGHALAQTGHADLVVLGAVPLPDALARKSVWNWDYAQGWQRDAARWTREPDKILQHFRAGNFSILREQAIAVGLTSGGTTVAYHEDYEFGLRCLRAGLQAIYLPQLVAEHHLDRTAEQYLRDARRQGRAAVALHRVDPEHFPPFDLDEYARATPRLLRPLVRRAGRGRRRQLSQMLLILASRALFRCGFRGAARSLAWTLRRQEAAAAARAHD